MDDDKKPEGQTSEPNLVFLVAGLVSIAGAVLVYIFEDKIRETSSDFAFAVGLMLLVLLTLFFLLCYRTPALGDRLLGKHVPPQAQDKANFKYSAGFDSQSGIDAKRLNTQRKSTRAARKKAVAAQRAIDAEKTDSKGEPQ